MTNSWPSHRRGAGSWLGVVLFLALWRVAIAQDAGAAPAQPAAPESIEGIIEAYEKSERDFWERYQQATPEQRKELLKERPDGKNLLPKLRAMAEAQPSTSAAARAWSWILAHAEERELKRVCLDRLAGDHADSASLKEVCQGLGYETAAFAADFLRKIARVSTLREVKGTANYSLAKVLAKRNEMANRLKSASAEEREQYTGWIGQETLEELSKLDSAALAKNSAELEQLLDLVAKDFADIPLWGNRTLGKAAQGDLFELRNLVIGKPAPEITGEDIFGKSFKLSDYRGKVVVLDFWGDW